MKPLLLLCLTISLSSPMAFSRDVTTTAAPHDKEPITVKDASSRAPEEMDSIRTGQSSTRRDYDANKNYKTCRDANGSWLRPGDMGYTTCMNDPKMLRR